MLDALRGRRARARKAFEKVKVQVTSEVEANRESPGL